MSYTKLEINLRKMEFNARMEVQKLAEYGVTVMGVNKVFNGLSETASAIVFTFFHADFSIHYDKFGSSAVLSRICVRRIILDGLRIENDNISFISLHE
jgi:hypothetical protein